MHSTVNPLLLLETRASGEGHKWRYAAARMTSVPIEVQYQNQVVWTMKAWDWKRDPKGPYITLSRKWDGGEIER